MLIQTEAKAQGWRGMAVFKDGRPDMLLVLGRSSKAVRDGYVESYWELLDEAEQSRVASVLLQRWHGAPDAGYWIDHSELRIPQPVKSQLVRMAA